MGPRRGCPDARSAWAERGPDDCVQRSGLRGADHARQFQQARPRARDLVEAGRSDHLGIQAAPERQIPQRRCIYRRRRRVLVPARAAADLRLQGLPRQHQGDREGRRPDGAAEDQRPEPAGAGQPHHRLCHEQEVGGGEQRDQAAGLQEQGREFRGTQRQRHGAVHPRIARARREDGREAQRRLLGSRRDSARDHRADTDDHQAGRDPCGRAALRRSRRRAGRARCRISSG